MTLLQEEIRQMKKQLGSSGKGRLRLSLEWALIFLLAGFLCVSPWFYGLVRFREQLVVECVVFGLFLVSFPFLDWKGIYRQGGNKMDTWVVASGVLTLSYVFISALPYQSFLAFARFATLITFYTLMRSVVMTENRLKVFLWTLVLSGFFYAAYGLAQYQGYFPHAFWFQPSDLASRFVNSGHFGVFLLFSLLTAIGLFVSSRNWFVRIFLVPLIFGMIWALMLTRSRTSWSVFLIGVILFFLFIGGRKKISGSFLGFILAGLMGGALLLTKGSWTLGFFGHRMQELFETKFYSLIQRLDLWKGSLAAIQDRPWGWGLGVYGSIFPQYKIQTDRFSIDYAHNEFLQTGVDLGIPGVFFLAGFMFFYFSQILTLLKRKDISEGRHTIGAVFAATFIGLAIASQVDFPLRIFANAFYFTAFLALSAFLLNATREKMRAQIVPSNLQKEGGFVRWVLLIFVLSAGTLTARQLLAEITFEKAQVLDQDFKWQDARSYYERSARLVPFYGRYQEGLGNLYYRKSSLTFQEEEKSRLKALATEAYEKAVRAFPYNAQTHHLLGILLEEKGDLAEAKVHLKEALHLEPKNGFYLSEYANFAYRHAVVKEALHSFGKLMQFPFWGETKESVCSILKKCVDLTEDLDQLRWVTPNNEEGHFCLGVAFGNKEKWDTAQSEFDRALERARGVSKQALRATQTQIEGFYISKNRHREVIELYQEALAKDPNDSFAKGRLESLSQSIS